MALNITGTSQVQTLLDEILMLGLRVSAMPEHERAKTRTRELSTQSPIASRTISLGAISGIAIGGALLLFTILITISIIHVKKKHRWETKNFHKASGDGNTNINLETVLRSTRPPDISIARRLSFDPFLPLPEDDNRNEWTKNDGVQRPTLAKSTPLPQRRFFRMSSVSWPLMSNDPVGFLPGQPAMVLSPVAPPGYVVQESKWPKRISPRLRRKNSQDSPKSVSPTKDPYPMDIMSYKKIHRRPASDNQLSTILGSNSKRLKAAQRHFSLAPTLSRLGQPPGPPPSERLPTPPMRKFTASRAELISQDDVESVGSSICDVYSQTPSPKKRHQRAYSKGSPIAPITHRILETKDSLCVSYTPDVVTLTPLHPPSKSSSQSAQRLLTNQGLGGAKEISALIHQENRAPLYARGPQDITNDYKILSPPQLISLLGDPFYSAASSSKSIMANSPMQGPCPIDSRRTISGQRAPSERPANSWSTPRNAQSTSKRKLPGPRMTSEPNLFQCFPQGAMHARATQTSPKQPNIKRKGHKRSNIIRMSNLSRSTSTVQYEKNDWQCGEVAYIDGQKETHVSSRVGRGSGYETR